MKTIKILMSAMVIAMSTMIVSGTAFAQNWGEWGYNNRCHNGQKKVCWRHCDYRGCWRHCEWRPCGWHRHHYYYR